MRSDLGMVFETFPFNFLACEVSSSWKGHLEDDAHIAYG